MRARQELRDLFRLRILQLSVLAALLAFVLWRSFWLKLTVRDLDNWWHLKVGDWILQNHSFPHNGIFSGTAAHQSWAAYSWGYEVLLSLSYKWFDLVGMAVFGSILTLLVAASVFHMTSRLSGRFWLACLIATVSCSIFLFTLCPRPVYFSMILFAIELLLILKAQSGQIEPLYGLPLLFFLWANLHIQFVYGLSIIGLLLGVNAIQRGLAKAGWEPEWLLPATLPIARLAAITAACFLAPCLSPYSFHLYGIVFRYATEPLYQFNREMLPIGFQVPSHYLQVVLTGAAFFVVGKRKPIDLFKLMMLILATVVGYRMMRDSWFVCITAAACIAARPASETEHCRKERWYEWAAIGAFLVIAGLLFSRDTQFTRAGLDARISTLFPVDAANYLRKHPQAGPLYNSYDWGGFLIWYLPGYPVAIDGRNDLYGSELSAHFVSTANGATNYANDTYLNQARVILLQREIQLASLLEGDPRFRKIYEDRLAVIFIPQTEAGEGPGASFGLPKFPDNTPE